MPLRSVCGLASPAPLMRRLRPARGGDPEVRQSDRSPGGSPEASGVAQVLLVRGLTCVVRTIVDNTAEENNVDAAGVALAVLQGGDVAEE